MIFSFLGRVYRFVRMNIAILGNASYYIATNMEVPTMPSEIGKRIQECLDFYHMSVLQLAREADVPRSALFRYISGETASIPADRLAKLAKQLYVSVDYLTGSGDYKRDYVHEFALLGYSYTEQDASEGYGLDEVAKMTIDQLENNETAKDVKVAVPDFKNAEEAIQFILGLPLVAAHGGYDLDSMTDQQKIEFANEIAAMIRIMGNRYSRKE